MIVMQQVRALTVRTPPVVVGMNVAQFTVAFDTTNDPAPPRSVLFKLLYLPSDVHEHLGA